MLADALRDALSLLSAGNLYRAGKEDAHILQPAAQGGKAFFFQNAHSTGKGIQIDAQELLPAGPDAKVRKAGGA